jgi:hypothetical protein
MLRVRFPYFMAGIVLAGLVSGAFAHSMVWKGALVLFPVNGWFHFFDKCSVYRGLRCESVIPATGRLFLHNELTSHGLRRTVRLANGRATTT